MIFIGNSILTSQVNNHNVNLLEKEKKKKVERIAELHYVASFFRPTPARATQTIERGKKISEQSHRQKKTPKKTSKRCKQAYDNWEAGLPVEEVVLDRNVAYVARCSCPSLSYH